MVRSLTRAVYAKWIPLIGREPFPMVADYTEAVKAHLIDVHEQDGVVVALIEIIPRDDHLVVENIAVAESHQGRGLGTALLDHAEAFAKVANLPIVRLFTNARFLSNVAFYSARGYREEARSSLADGGVVVHFAKAV